MLRTHRSPRSPPPHQYAAAIKGFMLAPETPTPRVIQILIPTAIQTLVTHGFAFDGRSMKREGGSIHQAVRKKVRYVSVERQAR